MRFKEKKMRIILFGFLILLVSVSSAQNEVLIATAINNARLYTNEVQQLANQQKDSQALHLKKVSSTLVFLSFSMPEKSLESWLKQCKIYGATPVIRGLINNSFKETIQTIYRLSEKTQMGIQLDPVLFQTFDITQVPAVVSVTSVPDCPKAMDCKSISFDKLYGEVTLDYALARLKEVHQ